MAQSARFAKKMSGTATAEQTTAGATRPSREDPALLRGWGAEERGLGPYTALIHAHESEPILRVVEHMIALEDIAGLIDRLLSAERSLRRRRLVDQICGNCVECGNIRMVNRPPKHMPADTQWAVHCPRCEPKIEAYLAAHGPDSLG